MNIIVSYGRMNPPTIGHMQLLNHCKELKLQYRSLICDVYLSNSHDNKKNPLTPEEKVRLINMLCPKSITNEVNITYDSGIRNIFDVMIKYSNPNANIIVVCGYDRLNEYQTKLTMYNGKDYHYKSIQCVAYNSRVIVDNKQVSGTRLRTAIINDDYSLFERLLMGDDKTKSEYKELIEFVYNTIKERLSTNHMKKRKPRMIKECVELIVDDAVSDKKSTMTLLDKIRNVKKKKNNNKEIIRNPTYTEVINNAI